jgi:hypothetical protein
VRNSFFEHSPLTRSQPPRPHQVDPGDRRFEHVSTAREPGGSCRRRSLGDPQVFSETGEWSEVERTPPESRCVARHDVATRDCTIAVPDSMSWRIDMSSPTFSNNEPGSTLPRASISDELQIAAPEPGDSSNTFVSTSIFAGAQTSSWSEAVA